MDSILYVYISWIIQGMWIIYITLEREDPILSKLSLECQVAPLVHSRAAASFESKMATMQHKIFFCVREFIKTESATAVQRAFRLRLNIQPPTRKSICPWSHQFEQIDCVKAVVQLSPSFWITLYIIPAATTLFYFVFIF